MLDEARKARVADREENDNALREINAEREAEFEERAQEERTAYTLVELAAHDDRAIREIDAAVARLEDGNYGTCAECGVDIPIARLRAFPSARRCVECQRDAEKERAAYARPIARAGMPADFGDESADDS